MRDWKTTFFGVVAGLAGFVIWAPVHFPPVVVDFAGFIAAGGLVGLGISAAQVRRANNRLKKPPR